jgi:hypothetical protein
MDAKVKGIDKAKSKENYNTTSSRLFVELETMPEPDWAGAFNAGWAKTELRQIAQEAQVSGNAVMVTYLKGKSVPDIYGAVGKAVEEINKTQDSFYGQIDSINATDASGQKGV